ncbi:MAG: GNAT family N-acetyltransferase [Ruminococcus sp.]|nr:GNAT family N-acetyltransferase [Ruminococcus sp.]
MNYNIRKIRENEYYLLEDFIYEAIFIPEGVEPPPREIVNQPDIQVYIRGFGTEKDDICFVAEVENKVVGAVWVRDMEDYGHIADGVPSFAISLYKEYRNCGIGTEMMKTMLAELKNRGYARTSLAVQKANYAVRMYIKVGFVTIDENDEEYIMVCDLQNTPERQE